MPFELEIKARVSDPEAVISYLTENGWDKVRYITEDLYFEHPCKQFSDGEELRLRKEIRGNREKTVLTYKSGSGPTSRLEIEVEVDAEIERILNLLGFKPLISKRKDGYILVKGEIKATVCFVSGSYSGKNVELGHFIELEIISETKDASVVKKLEKLALSIPGVAEIDNRYYMQMVIEKASKMR